MVQRTNNKIITLCTECAKGCAFVHVCSCVCVYLCMCNQKVFVYTLKPGSQYDAGASIASQAS